MSRLSKRFGRRKGVGFEQKIISEPLFIKKGASSSSGQSRAVRRHALMTRREEIAEGCVGRCCRSKKKSKCVSARGDDGASNGRPKTKRLTLPGRSLKRNRKRRVRVLPHTAAPQKG
eukprot:INCI9238.1.p3 GENE.INCI9238.1~~INCI9238.1.p3  ORF type:complete len:117 (+),score=7.36 INCI9238.1:226-576(+)